MKLNINMDHLRNKFSPFEVDMSIMSTLTVGFSKWDEDWLAGANIYGDDCLGIDCYGSSTSNTS